MGWKDRCAKWACVPNAFYECSDHNVLEGQCLTCSAGFFKENYYTGFWIQSHWYAGYNCKTETELGIENGEKSCVNDS